MSLKKASSKQITIQKSSGRSASYPSTPIDSAIELLEALYKNQALGPYTRELLATGIGYKGLSGVAASKIAALIHFGLLEKISRDKYELSQIAKEILFPKDDIAQEKTLAIRTAVQQPTLYADLISRYKEQPLPLMLENILIQEYRIQPKAAKAATTIFRRSLEFSGLLEDGRVTMPDERPESAPTEDKHSTANAKNEHRVIAEKTPDEQSLTIDLPQEIIITIKFPARLSYEVSTGLFSSGIKELERSANELA